MKLRNCIFLTLQLVLHSSVVQAAAYSSHNTAASVVTANRQGGSKLLKEETTLLPTVPLLFLPTESLPVNAYTGTAYSVV